jgi:hypothetical protein
MIRYRCDGCGLDLQPDGSNHYIIKIEAFAAAGKLEFTQQDLGRDHEAEIRRMLAALANHPLDAIEEQVYRALRYDLCPACHRKFLATPLASLGPNAGPPSPL